MIRRPARRASLDGTAEIRPHLLRVALITGAREAAIPLEDVQDAAGHADPAPPDASTAAATPWTATPPTRSPPC
ncbi:MAG: site-specific integrase [Pseudonocardiales bacterium]|nr:site-specific integrase [Pseudonocardiales bacterium]